MKKSCKSITTLVLLIFTLSCVFVSGTAFADEGALPNPVAHYKLDGDTRDSSGANHGSIVGNITYVDAVSGKGAKFDGKSCIEVKHNASLNLEEGFTFSVWIYKDDIRPKRNQPILSKLGSELDSNSPSYQLLDYDMEPQVIVYDEYENHAIMRSKWLDFHKWTLLTVTNDGEAVRFYYNGVLTDDLDEYTIIPASNGKLVIGKSNFWSETSFFKGIMDDLRIYNVALTPSQVEAIYNTAMKGPGKDLVEKPNKLVAHYKFDGSLLDETLYGNNGELVGTATGITYDYGKDERAAKFDGKSYIKVKDSDSLDLNTGFTFSLWYKKDPTSKDRLVPFLKKQKSSYSADESSYFFYEYDSVYRLNMFDIYGNSTGGAYTDFEPESDKWIFSTVTYDSESLRFFVDGVLVEEHPIEGVLYHSSGDLLIGGNTGWLGTAFFKGLMDDLRIYNYPLTPKEVKALFDSYKPKTVIMLQVDNPMMKLNGVEMEVDPGKGTKPVIVKGRTLVPIRAIVEGLGGKVLWDGATKKVTIELDTIKMELWLDNPIAYVNGVKTDLAALNYVPPQVINGRTMLPLRFVTDSLGCELEWDAATKGITIIK